MALELQYGEVIRSGGAQIRVSLSGYEADVAVDVKLLQPGGFSSVKSWVAPQAGDCVAVLVDTERPEDSVVLGGVYTDARGPIGTGETIVFQASKVLLGSDVDTAKKASRDDHVQTELAAIKAELDLLTAAFNAHVHAIPAVSVSAASPTPDLPTRIGITATGTSATTTPPHEQSYTVGATAADSVYVK